MIFIPAFDSYVSDDSFLLLHKANLKQKIRLMFITKEEMITTNQRLNVSDLKDKIKEEFGYAPYQQNLFHNKRELEEGELLTELSMEQKGDLIIKVIFINSWNCQSLRYKFVSI